MMKSEYSILFILGVFLSSCSQILLKKSTFRSYRKRIYEYLNFNVILGYFIFFAVTILIMFCYKEIPLKYGAVLESLGYGFVLILGKIFLNERLTKRKVFGNIIIIVGIIIFNFK